MLRACLKSRPPPSRGNHSSLINIPFRTIKDHHSYAKETKQLEDKLEALKAQEGADSHDIKKMGEQVAETAQMLPNVKTRIETAMDDLEGFLGSNQENEELAASEDWKAAE